MVFPGNNEFWGDGFAQSVGIFYQVKKVDDMKKQIFAGYWFYVIGGSICGFLLPIGWIIFEVLQILTVSKETNPTMVVAYYAFPFVILTCFYLMFAIGYYALQFTIISESGIKTRCLWRTIRKLKWEEVKEVRLESFYVSSANGFTSRWYVFDDGEERFQKNGIVHKNSHITLNYSKRAKRAVETFWKGEVVDKIYTEE